MLDRCRAFLKPCPLHRSAYSFLRDFKECLLFPLAYSTAWKQWASPVPGAELPLEPPATNPTPEAQTCCSASARSAWPHTLVMLAVCNSLQHQRGTSETSESAQSSVPYIITSVFFLFFFFTGNFQNHSRGKPPPVMETQHENSSVPIKLV